MIKALLLLFGILAVLFIIAIKQGQKDHEVFQKQLKDNHINEKDIKILLCKGQKNSIIYTNDKKLYIIMQNREVIQIEPKDITYGASQFHIGNLYEEYEKMARLKAILEKEIREVG